MSRRHYDDDDRSSKRTKYDDRDRERDRDRDRSYGDDRYRSYSGQNAPNNSSSDRWTPGGGASAATSGYIHPDRQIHSNTQSNYSRPPPPSSSSQSYSLNSQNYSGGAKHSYNHAPPPSSTSRPAPSASPLSTTTTSTIKSSSSSSSTANVTQALLEQERLAEAAYQARMEAKMKEMEEGEEKSEEQLALERAKKREAILAKFKVQAPQPLASTLTQEQKEKMLEQAGAVDSAVVPNTTTTKTESPASQSMTDVAPPAPVASVPSVSTTSAAATVTSSEESKSSAAGDDDDEYDMFASDDRLAPEAEAAAEGNRDLTVSGVGEMLDSWDDADNYYRYRLGDLLEGGRYRVTGFQGSGVFSTVLRVREMLFTPGVQGGAAASTEGRELVVKLIRANETMYKAGMKELEFLKILSDNDPDNKKHCVKLLANFMHRNHLCLVFEPLNMDLRKVIKKFGSIGVTISACRSYAKQLLLALKHLKKCQILHSDIKPDNMLVNEEMNIIKLCDFGSASKLNEECEITPLLVSRFYRAPEIMLGLKYDAEIDKWSVACCLFELYTGKILFTGADNNSMLHAIQNVKGKFPKRMLQRGKFVSEHFDPDLNMFELRKLDHVTGQERKIQMRFDKPNKDIYHSLKQHSHEAKVNHQKLKQFADLLEKMLMLDPQQRASIEDLMQHPFIVQDD